MITRLFVGIVSISLICFGGYYYFKEELITLPSPPLDQNSVNRSPCSACQALRESQTDLNSASLESNCPTGMNCCSEGTIIPHAVSQTPEILSIEPRIILETADASSNSK